MDTVYYTAGSSTEESPVVEEESPPSSEKTYVSSSRSIGNNNAAVINKAGPKVQVVIHPDCPIGCYTTSENAFPRNPDSQQPRECGVVTISRDVAGEAAKLETKAVKNRILLCWLTLTIPLFLYLKFKFWDLVPSTPHNV
jgi:hypothetical protein